MGRTPKEDGKTPELTTWKKLNDALMATEDEKQVYKLIQKERAGDCRIEFIARIYGRFAILRAIRERKELGIF